MKNVNNMYIIIRILQLEFIYFYYQLINNITEL